MYEFVPPRNRRGVGACLSSVPPAALGSATEVTSEFCYSLPYETLADEHWSNCRTLITAAHWCQLSGGEPCSRQEIADLCNLSSESDRPPDCAFYVQPAETPVRRQTPANDQDIRELQTWLVSVGCPLREHGIDGIWGSETAGAVRCAEGQGHAATIASRFPWVSTMRMTPTGNPRPPDFTFDPGSFKRTPEQVVAAGNPGGIRGSVSNSGSTQADIAADRQQRAGLSAIPTWGWGLIAVGGVSLLGIIGLLVLGGDRR